MSQTVPASRSPAENPTVGVEGLLAKKAKVFYENLFSTRHMGRVLDFLLFEAKEFIFRFIDAPFTEYRIRHALELGVFLAWTHYREGERSKCVELEVGWDGEKIVLSISFYVHSQAADFFPGFEAKNEVSKRIQQMLHQIEALSERLAVRHDPVSGRMQILISMASSEGAQLFESQYRQIDATSSKIPDVSSNEAPPRPLFTGGYDGFVSEEEAQESSPQKTSRQTAENEPAAQGAQHYKSQIQELSRRIDELQSKEVQWRQQAEQLRQKEEAFAKTKEALASAMSSLEKSRAAVLAASSHKVEIAQLSQQLMHNVTLINDLKRQNRELQNNGGTEVKHKIEQANKIAKAMKDELDKTRKKFEDLKLEESKLRIEVARLQAQLKSAGKEPMVAPSKTKP